MRYVHLTASANAITPDGPSTLWTVNVNTASTGSSISVYDGQTSFASSATTVAVIDGATPASKVFGVLCNHGITIRMTGAPDVTIGYE